MMICVAFGICQDDQECPHGPPHEDRGSMCSDWCAMYPEEWTVRCYEADSLRYHVARTHFLARVDKEHSP